MEKIRWVLARRQNDLTLVLANIHDPHNVSAIYRSCDAFGVPRVHLYYTDTAFPALSGRSSASARKWVETQRHQTPTTLKGALKERGCRILVTSCSPSARPFNEWDLAEPTAVIMGNEHGGVAAELLDMADGEMYIPMFGMIQSFNVSVAAAVILAEASRQRQRAGRYDSPTYSEEEYTALLEVWTKK